MEALVVTLREGVEAALIIGLILAFLNRAGRTSLRRYVYAGLLAAVAASLVGAVAFSSLGVDPENEVLEGTLLAVAAVLVITLVVWMWRASRNVKRHILDRLDGMTTGSTRRQAWVLAAFTFLMVFREGVEAVLLLAALSLTAAGGLLNLIGGISGLALAVTFGVVFTRGIVRIDLRPFFAVTGLVLIVLALRLLAGSVHEFSEAGLLPSTPLELGIVGFIVRDTTSVVILLLLITVPLLPIVASLRKRNEAAAPSGESSAARRLRLAAQRRARRWQMAAVTVTLGITAALGLAAYASAANGYRPEPEAVAPVGGAVKIPTEAMETGLLYKFVYRGSHVPVRFLVVKRVDGTAVVAADACSICPPRGYHQEGDHLMCDNCNAPINLASVGLPGGCNPVPLPAAVRDGSVTIGIADLEAAQSVFAA